VPHNLSPAAAEQAQRVLDRAAHRLLSEALAQKQRPRIDDEGVAKMSVSALRKAGDVSAQPTVY
jgi:hypothetical protein